MYASVVLGPKVEPRVVALRDAISERSAGYRLSLSATIGLLVEKALPALEAELGLNLENTHHE